MSYIHECCADASYSDAYPDTFFFNQDYAVANTDFILVFYII